MTATEVRPARPAATRPTPAPNGAAPRRAGRLPHFPALDGLRGIAVISVLFFHGGFSWAVGGYLGVSTFFTLSGFLITSLLLSERLSTGRIELGSFWSHRFRRLLPAALAALALAVVVAMLVDPVARRNVGGDVLSSLGYVANWRFVFTGKSYAELFATPSPVQHFWSLAIEEQFYLLYPLLVIGILRFTRDSRKLFGLVLAVLTGVSVLLPLVLGFGHDRIYYGTDARAAELLVGGLLATVLYHRSVTERLARPGRLQYVIAGIGAVSLSVCVVLWSMADQQSDPLYRGGFFAYSLLSASVILAALMPVGPVGALLSTRFLRWMGRISYGVYLYHWPIFLALTPARVPLDGIALFAVRVAVTLGVAVLSYRYLEMPIRQGRPIFSRTSLPLRPARVAPILLTALAAFALVVGATAPAPEIDFEAARSQITFSSAPPPSIAEDTVIPPRPRVALFGDSTALTMAFGVGQHLKASNKGDLVEGVTELGCSIIRGGYMMNRDGIGKNEVRCDKWDVTFAEQFDRAQPNVVIVQDGPWEVVDHQFADEPMKWREIGDPVFDRKLLAEMTGVVDLLYARGATVFWMTLPPMGAPPGYDPRAYRGDGADPARQKRYNELVQQVAKDRPGKVHVVDLNAYLQKTGDDKRLRPDGVHFSAATAEEVAQKWLVDLVIAQYEEDWKARHPPGSPTTTVGALPPPAAAPSTTRGPTGSAPSSSAPSGTAARTAPG